MQFTVRDIKKIPLQYFMDKNVDVHLYNFFSHIATECWQQVSLRTGSPKMARNEQVCAHQKSYRK